MAKPPSKQMRQQTDAALAERARACETLIAESRQQLKQTFKQSKREKLQRTIEGATKGLEAVRHEIARRQMEEANGHSN